MKPRRKSLMLKVHKWAPLLLGGAVLQFSLAGCDPEVRNSVLSGVQTSLSGLVTSVIDAVFMSLMNAGDTTQTVAKAVHDVAQTFLA